MTGAAPQRMGWDPAPRQGWVAPHIASEFPGLGIAWVEVDAQPGTSPDPVRHRLGDLSDRTYGSQAIRLRERPIPWAYRVFYGLPADALNIAIVETGVALRVFDANRIEGALCIRDSAPGESLAGQPGELATGTLTIADERQPLGLLFGPTAEGYGVERDTQRVAIAAIQVKGVPQIAVEEALWMAASTLESV
jgi:hypothetical protein